MGQHDEWYEHPQYLPDNNRDLEQGEAAVALREAWHNIYGEYPSDRALALLWSQSALETGRWRSIHCFNFGNIRKVHNPDDGHYFTMYDGNEIIKGKTIWFKPPEPLSHFRGYKTVTEGAEDYIKLVSQRPRYAKAWAMVMAGDPVGYCRELKAAGYFTANLEHYTKPVVSLTNEFIRRKDELLSWKINDTEPAPPLSSDSEPDTEPGEPPSDEDTDPSTYEPDELVNTEPWNPPPDFIQPADVEKEPKTYDPQREKDPSLGVIAMVIAVGSALYVWLSTSFHGCF